MAMSLMRFPGEEVRMNDDFLDKPFNVRIKFILSMDIPFSESYFQVLRSVLFDTMSGCENEVGGD